MGKYEIMVKVTALNYYEVEADNEEQAMQKYNDGEAKYSSSSDDYLETEPLEAILKEDD